MKRIDAHPNIDRTITAVTLTAQSVLMAQQTPLETAVQLEAQAKATEEAGRTNEAFVLYTKAERAMRECERAVHTAPWAAEHAFNLALVQEKPGYYEAAAANLDVYVASGATDAGDARRNSVEREVKREHRQAALKDDVCSSTSPSAALNCGGTNVRPILTQWRTRLIANKRGV